MTPQERQLVDDLFDRLAKVESAPRDPEAAGAIAQGLRKAPNAVYALVQTVAGAGRSAEARPRAASRNWKAHGRTAPIRRFPRFDARNDFRAGAAARLGAERAAARAPGRPTWNSGQVLQQAQDPRTIQPGAVRPAAQGQPYGGQQAPMGGGGGSFLGTAAAAAAGVVGGSLLLGSIRSMMGGGGQPAELRRHRRRWPSRQHRRPQAVERSVRRRSGARGRDQRHRFVRKPRRRLSARDCSTPRRTTTVRAPDCSTAHRTTTITTTWIIDFDDFDGDGDSDSI